MEEYHIYTNVGRLEVELIAQPRNNIRGYCRSSRAYAYVAYKVDGTLFLANIEDLVLYTTKAQRNPNLLYQLIMALPIATQNLINEMVSGDNNIKNVKRPTASLTGEVEKNG